MERTAWDTEEAAKSSGFPGGLTERDEWLAGLSPGDYVRWASFDGASTWRVVGRLPDGKIEMHYYLSRRTTRFAADGYAEIESYGFRSHLSRASTRDELSFRRNELRIKLEDSIKHLRLEDLEAIEPIVDAAEKAWQEGEGAGERAKEEAQLSRLAAKLGKTVRDG